MIPVTFHSFPLPPHNLLQQIIQFQCSSSFVVRVVAINGEANGCIIEGVLVNNEIVVNALR